MSTMVRKRDSAVTAWSRLVRIHQRLDKESERNFAAWGLNSAKFDVLARVGAREGLTQGELAETLLVTKGNISQLVSRMEDEGWLRRQGDGRFQRLFLSERGHRVRQEALPRQEEFLAASLAQFSAEEKAELVRLLRKWERS